MLSLLKAVLTEDMNIFSLKSNVKSQLVKKYLFPFFLFTAVGFGIGTYAYEIAKILHPVNLTFVMLSIFIIIVTFFTFLEGIYKSQGILFDSKDNDLLFSMPISKSKILFVRLFKFILFQVLYNMLFLLPAIIVYIYFEHPSISFYFISILMILLIPIIPTIISSILGYLIRLVSNKSNNHKIAEAIMTILIFIIITFLGYNMDSFLENLVQNATSINDLLIKIYYPIGLYINLITSYNLEDLFKLLLINLIPFIIFIIFFSKYYYNLIFIKKINHKEKSTLNKIIFKNNKPVKTLVIKELKRLTYSPVYMFNSCFGLIILVGASIMLFIDSKEIINGILVDYGITNFNMAIIFYLVVLFSGLSTSLTSSCISLEGKNINTIKCLPISEKVIIKSKIIYPFIVEIPFIILSIIIFIIAYKTSFVYILFLLAIGIVSVLYTSIAGILINLKYPKLSFASDTEVVKQSLSSFLAVFLGFGTFILSLFILYFLANWTSISTSIILHITLMSIITIILYLIVMKIGPKEFKKLYV